MGLLDEIKNQVKKSGTNKGKFVYFKANNKVRVRFLNDLEDGLKILFHDSFSKGINTPCQAYYGRECQFCGDDELRSRENFAWSVWDHEAKEVKIVMFAVNSFTPIPALVAMYETYGNVIDRDYVITKTGTNQSTAYSVVPMDKAKFTNMKAKPFTKAKLLEMIDKAFSDDSGRSNSDDDDGEKKPVKKPGKADVADKNSYKEYEARELYTLCVDRGLDPEKKKPRQYYVDMLDANDAEDVDDDEVDYNTLSPKELYKLCTDRDLDAEQKKNKEYYIKVLEDADRGEDDWGDEEDDEDTW